MCPGHLEKLFNMNDTFNFARTILWSMLWLKLNKKFIALSKFRNESRGVNKIPPCVASLQETENCCFSFWVFRQISKNTQDQMPSLFKLLSTMLKQFRRSFSIHQTHAWRKITALDQSVENASQILNETVGSKNRKLLLYRSLAFTDRTYQLWGRILLCQAILMLSRWLYQNVCLGLSVNEAQPHREECLK